MAALAVLHRLSIIHLDHDRAVRSLAFVAPAPGAVAFAMAYSDSLFLLLAAGTFLAAEQRRWWLMALLYGLATLTRLQGVLLGIPLAILIASASLPPRRLALARRVAHAASRMAGRRSDRVRPFAAYLGATFGDPLGMFTAQKAWSQIGQEPTVRSRRSSIASTRSCSCSSACSASTCPAFAFRRLTGRLPRTPHWRW